MFSTNELTRMCHESILLQEVMQHVICSEVKGHLLG